MQKFIIIFQTKALSYLITNLYAICGLLSIRYFSRLLKLIMVKPFYKPPPPPPPPHLSSSLCNMLVHWVTGFFHNYVIISHQPQLWIQRASAKYYNCYVRSLTPLRARAQVRLADLFDESRIRRGYEALHLNYK